MPRKKESESIATSLSTNDYTIEIKYTDNNGNEQVVHAKGSLNLSEQYALLNSIVNDIFTDGTYQPVFKDYSTRFEFINYFTDLKLSEQNLTSEEQYYIIMESSIFENLVTSCNNNKMSLIFDILDDMIEHKKKCIENKSEFDNLCSDIRGLVREYSGKFNEKDIKNIKKFIGKLANSNIDGKTIIDYISSKIPKDNVVNIPKV